MSAVEAFARAVFDAPVYTFAIGPHRLQMVVDKILPNYNAVETAVDSMFACLKLQLDVRYDNMSVVHSCNGKMVLHAIARAHDEPVITECVGGDMIAHLLERATPVPAPMPTCACACASASEVYFTTNVEPGRKYVRMVKLADGETVRDMLARIQTSNYQTVAIYHIASTPDPDEYIKQKLAHFANYINSARPDLIVVPDTRAIWNVVSGDKW